MVRLARLVLGGALLAWLADWWLGEEARGQTRPSIAGLELVGPIESSVVIDAPVERVWSEIADIPSQGRWMKDLRSVRVVTPGPIRVGSRVDGRVSAYGITMPDPVEVSVWEPPLLFGIRHVGPWKGDGLIRLSLEGDATRVDWTEQLTAPILPNLADVVQHLIFGPIFQADLENLKSLVEGAPAAAETAPAAAETAPAAAETAPAASETSRPAPPDAAPTA